MARININEKWFNGTDPRRRKFAKAVGDEELADGVALRFWRLGQDAYSKGRLVNKKAFFMIPHAKAFIECELAEERDGGVYIKGSKREFEWLAKFTDGRKLGGKKSSERPRDAKGRLLSKRKGGESRPAKPSRELDASPAEPAALSLSLTLPLSTSLSQSPTQTQSEMHIGANAPHPAQAGMHPLMELWNQHCGKLPKVKTSNPYRNKQLANKWREQTPDEWVMTIKKMAESKFCNGISQSGWRASFDWILQKDNHLKVNEGKYDNDKGAKHTAQSQKYDKLDEIEQHVAAKGKE